MSEFDYGAEPVAGGKSFKNPLVGKHAARLRSIIHCGMYEEVFDKKKKPAAPEIVAIFELKEEHDFDEDGTTPLEISKEFPLRKGDKATLTKFMAALDPDGTAKGFDDLIGRVCELELKGSKELDDDKKPKYVNLVGFSTLHPKLAAITEELSVEGVGHCRFNEITEAAVKELNPIREVANVLIQGLNYTGSKAEAVVEEIRKSNPDFAKKKAKEEDTKTSGEPEPTSSRPTDEPTPEPAPEKLDESEEF